jgi:3-oxoacyl-[acyl-carrier protein] reductase
MSTSLTGLAVLITGGSSGIGRAIALAVARAGANVGITYRANHDGAEDVVREVDALGRQAAAFPLQLSDVNAIEECGAAFLERFNRLDVWINNAGADVLTGDAAKVSEADKLDRLLAVDLRGTMLASWRAAEIMAQQPDGGVIINMSWDHVLSGMPGRNPEMFAAVKGGVLAFSKALARSVAPRVRVNVLAPGWIETAFAGQLDARRHEAIRSSIPLGRWGTPDDVANAAVFLASPAASYMTGQTLLVGGGVVMQ